jgi:sporulation protein YlmC with PRC-barrel domain
MLCSGIENNVVKAKSRLNKPLITFLIALAGLVLSSFNLYDARIKSSIDVILGRQVRFFVAFGEEGQRNPKPCIMMTVIYNNSGGKVGTVFDTKLNVKWLSGERIALEKEFQALRELDNFLTAEGDCTQYPISPVVVLGKSSEVRRYVFTPYETIRQKDIPKNFDLEIEVYTQSANLWSLKSRYRVDNVSDVWQDLESDTTFEAKVLDIREAR